MGKKLDGRYKRLRKELQERGHVVSKRGDIITIEPNNCLYGAGVGFYYFTDIIKGWENDLDIIERNHHNTFVYWIKCKFKD